MPIQLEDTPILQQLISHTARSKLPLHVPGHHQGRNLPEIFSEWFGSSPKLDLTELPGLDNLHHAKECILASEKLCASHYGSDACFYSINGSTACIMAAIASLTSSGQKILFMNPFHLSAWRGIVLSGVRPQFLPFHWDNLNFTFAPPTVQDLAKRLERESDFAAIYLTSPTYQGRIADVRRIVELAHQYQIPVIVDEAHGAHLGLGEVFPEHSVHAGADVVVQSAHKTLPSFTQSAWVHVQGSLVKPQRVLDELNFLQSTSPSYLLLASLDIAQAWLRIEGPKAAREFMENRSAVFQDDLDAGMVDPLRYWIPIGNIEQSRSLEMMFRDKGIYVEIADITGILAMFGFFMKPTHFNQLKQVLDLWNGDGSYTIDSKMLQNLLARATDTPLCCTPREAHLAKKVVVPLEQSVGEICGELITPYPPGVPILLPGQKIEREMVEGIVSWLRAGYTMNGLTEGLCMKTIV